MRNIRSSLLATIAVAGASLHVPPSLAQPDRIVLAAASDIQVREAWARASAGAATTGAVYVTLVGGTQADSLVSVSTPVAATAQVHETTSENGVLKMRAAGAVPIPSGQVVTLAPNGMHIMLMGLTQKLTAGQSFPLTLTFAHAAPVTVDVTIRPLGRATTSTRDSGQMSMPMGAHDHMQ